MEEKCRLAPDHTENGVSKTAIATSHIPLRARGLACEASAGSCFRRVSARNRGRASAILPRGTDPRPGMSSPTLPIAIARKAQYPYSKAPGFTLVGSDRTPFATAFTCFCTFGYRIGHESHISWPRAGDRFVPQRHGMMRQSADRPAPGEFPAAVKWALACKVGSREPIFTVRQDLIGQRGQPACRMRARDALADRFPGDHAFPRTYRSVAMSAATFVKRK